MGSLLVGVWIPSALALIVMSELSVLASGITDPLGGAIVPGILLAGAATLVFGAVSALLHDDIGEIVGFIAVGNAGWLALAAAAALQSPTDTSSRLIVLPGILTISLFGLWLVSVRRRYGTTSISELGGWARRTGANGIALVAAIIALAALPPGAVLAARLNLLLLGGNPLIALFAFIGQILLIVAAIRLLLVGFTPQSQTVHEAETRPFANIITVSLVAGSIFVAAAAAGWLALESGGTGPLPQRQVCRQEQALNQRQAVSRVLCQALSQRRAPRYRQRYRQVWSRQGVGRSRQRRSDQRSRGNYSSSERIQASVARVYSTRPPSGNQSAISAAAVSGASDAWIRFFAVSSAKSPRIVPGADSCGFVAPTIERTTAMAFGPSRTIATTGPDEMNSTRPFEEGALCMHGVVGLSELRAHRGDLQGDNLEATLFESRDHSTSKLALYAVWLDENKGALAGAHSSRLADLVGVRFIVTRRWPRPRW